MMRGVLLAAGILIGSVVFHYVALGVYILWIAFGS